MRNSEAEQATGSPQHERGAVSFIIALLVLFGVFITLGAIAMDLSATANRGQELQSAADAAALAGVIEYQDVRTAQIALGATPAVADAAGKAAAAIAIDNVLLQNAIIVGPEISRSIDFPNAGAQVFVRVVDDTNSSILSPIAGAAFGFDQKVEREATAEFLACNACSFPIDIPEQPQPVDAEGNGDGYQPIEVGNRLYGLNHNSTSREIVCMDITTSTRCWPEPNTNPVTYEDGRFSHAGNAPPRSPEMPHTAVIDDKIYWSASTSTGHYLYCYDTDPNDALQDAPCTTQVQLTNIPRGDESDFDIQELYPGEDQNDRFKDEGRGGGTLAYDDKVFVFTDSHEVHCYNPASGGACAGYNQRPGGALPTGLDPFPEGDEDLRNLGGSIDRIVDEQTGFIYSTIHIVTEVPDTFDCSTLEAPTTVDDLIDRVVVLEESGSYLSADANDSVPMTNDRTDPIAQWRVTTDPGQPYIYLQSVAIDEYLDAEDDPTVTLPTPLGTSVNRNEDDNRWILSPVPGGFTVESVGAPGTWIRRIPLTGEAQQDTFSPLTRWSIDICSDPAADLGYEAGTWVHCFNTGVVSGPAGACPTFDPGGAMHADASRFSGRLFFDYEPVTLGFTPIKRSICSTGFEDPLAASGNVIEVVCRSLTDGSVLPHNFAPFEARLNLLHGGGTSGAWGVPHYNAYFHRMFYPMNQRVTWNLCWDFNGAPQGLCGNEFQGTRPPNATGDVRTRDYGFLSKDNCVYALGHTAFFWSFQANDVSKQCVGATSQQDITLCNCYSGTSRWGILDFTQTPLDAYDVVRMWVTTDPPNDSQPGTVLAPLTNAVPPRNRHWELKPANGSRLIDLDDEVLYPELAAYTTAAGPTASIRLVIYIEATGTSTPPPNVPQGRLKFEIRPRLID